MANPDKLPKRPNYAITLLDEAISLFPKNKATTIYKGPSAKDSKRHVMVIEHLRGGQPVMIAVPDTDIVKEVGGRTIYTVFAYENGILRPASRRRAKDIEADRHAHNEATNITTIAPL